MLSQSFDDLKVEENRIVLERSKNIIITAPEKEVERRINNSQNQSGKWAEYIQNWKEEGRI